MNKERRNRLAQVDEALSNLASEVETLRDDEQEYFDVMPEGFQQGEKGDIAQEAISQMEEALTAIEEACTALGQAAI